MILITYPKTFIINVQNYQIIDNIKFLILKYYSVTDITPPSIEIRRLYIVEDTQIISLRIDKSLINTQYMHHSSLGVHYKSKLIIVNINRINYLKLLLL